MKMIIFVVKAVIDGENECVLMGAYPTLEEAKKRVKELTEKYKNDKETHYVSEPTELKNF